MKRFLEGVFRLQPGDLGRGALPFLYFFLVMGSYLIGRAVRDSLFLDKYKASLLPYADLVIAISVGFIVAGYLAIGRHVRLHKLLSGSLVLFAAVTMVFWYLLHYRPHPLVNATFYIWIGVLGVITPAQVWTLANFVFTTREAKRLVGMIASGSIVGAIVGGKLANLMAPAFGTESLLLVISGALVVCVVLVPMIWAQRPRSAAEKYDEEPKQEKPVAVMKALGLIGRSSYLRSLVWLILIASVVTTVAGWQFKALSKFFVPNKDELTAFYGNFYFYAGIAGLLVGWMVTGRLLKRFGLGPALFVVPGALFLGSVAVLFWGLATVWAAIGLRACINVLQYSIDKPSVEILYLPVPAEIKNQVKSFIDTVVWRSGDGLAGLLVLGFAAVMDFTSDQFTAQGISWVNLTLIVVWFLVAIVAKREYVGTLKESIQKHRLDAERATAPVLDRSTTEVLASSLTAADPKEILYALSLFETGRRAAVHPAVRGLLQHPAPEVRHKALQILGGAGDKSVLPDVEKLLQDADLEVRTEALLFLTHHAKLDPLEKIQELGDFPDFSIRSSIIAFLSQPGPTQNLEAAQMMLDTMVQEAGAEGKRARLEAARLLRLVSEGFDTQLGALLEDPDKEVVREALRAAGHLKRKRSLPRLIELLGDRELSACAADALAEFGDRVVGTLRDSLSDPDTRMEIRREIPAVLARIGTEAAERALCEHLLESETTLRYRIITSLNKIHQRHPDIPLDRQVVEIALAAEVMGHYRSYQILGTLGGNLNADDTIVVTLRDAMNLEVERIFRLLSLLFPGHDFHSAFVGIQSHKPLVHANSLEFLDNVLEPRLRGLLLPLIDSEVGVSGRIERAAKLMNTTMESREEAVAALVGSSDPWLKSCGAYAVGAFGLLTLEPQLDACLDTADPLLRETVRVAKLRLAQIRQTAGS
jgi:AAA family ATP:ADP antiporter